MTIAPFFSSRIGATVTPGVAAASGAYDISVTPGGKATSAFGNASRVLSAEFFPLNQDDAPASPTRNLLTVCLNGSGTDTVDTHDYWYCYKGWNSTGRDPDGGSVLTSPLLTKALGLFNGTPYALRWGIFDAKVPDADTFDDYHTGGWLLPGCSLSLDGSDSFLYYYKNGSPGGYHYDRMTGVANQTGYFHAVCASTYTGFYDHNTGAVRTDYLKMVLVQGTDVGMPLPA